MTKAQIHFSNKLEVLADVFKEELFPEGAKPFESRLIVVPHVSIKQFLMQRLAKDPTLQVAAGLSIVNLSQAFSKLTKKVFPSTMEVSLFLQHALIPLIETEEDLSRYFNTGARDKRIGPFCDILATHFLRYGVYGKKRLRNWQEKLWREVSRRWTFPIDFPPAKKKGEVHLFGFEFIPPTYFQFFEQLEAKFYLFSPCAIFWGDFYSKKEKARMQLDFFEEEENPLLANWGKVGRAMHQIVEDFPAHEHYVQVPENSCLQKLQNGFLEGTTLPLSPDETVHCFSAPHPFREVEILRDKLYPLFEKGILTPRDVQVFAPDIRKYAPFIEAVFSEVDFAISDLTLHDVDPVARGFAKLLSLPKNDFAVEEVVQLFSSPPFREKFHPNVALMRKWCEEANIRFEKSWIEGLNRLILGLGQLEGKEEPLPIVSITEMEDLNTLYVLFHSLKEDLSLCTDGTKWTISTWLRYFVCLLESYFAVDGSHELLQNLQSLAASCDHLDREEVSYESVERVINRLLQKKGKTKSAPHLQAIRFSSLSSGAVLPSKMICVLGMEEGAFPATEESSSLYVTEPAYRPKKGEEHRYLFVQLLSGAREFFWCSYSSEAPSELVEELFSEVGKQPEKIIAVPTPPTSPTPFLIPSFFQEEKLERVSVEEPQVVDVQKLFKFAKHPLRYYFHEVLGIAPEFGKGKEEGEFVLSPLTKYKLVREAFEKPLEEVFEKGKVRGDIPSNLLENLAREQMENEMSLYPEFPKQIEIEPIQIGKITIKGKLDNFTPKGLLVKGKNNLEDRIKFWPQALIGKRMGLPLFFLKDQKEGTVEGSLEDYLEYFLLAHKTPSPFFPPFARALLEKGPDELHKVMKRADDEIFSYLLFRDPFPDAKIIHQNWSSYLKGIFGGVHAKV